MIKVVCIKKGPSVFSSGLNSSLVLNRVYYVESTFNNINNINILEVYNEKDDKSIIEYYLSDYFITFQEWRNQQINKILEND